MKESTYRIIGLPFALIALVYFSLYVEDNEFPRSRYELDSDNIIREYTPPVEVTYFYNGEVLLPDYANPDTLIVTNAEALNEAMAPIEQGLVDAGDGDIAEVLYRYCVVKQ